MWLVKTIYHKLNLDRPVVGLATTGSLFTLVILLIWYQQSLKREIILYQKKLFQQAQNFKSQFQNLNEIELKLRDQELKSKTAELKATEMEQKLMENNKQLVEKDQQLTQLKDQVLHHQEIMKLIKASDLRITELKGFKTFLQSRAKVLFSPKLKLAYVHIANIPPAPEDQDYQLWMMEGDKPISGGILPVTEEGSFLLKVRAGLNIIAMQKLSAFVITLEPKGGGQKITGPTYFKGIVKL